MISAVHLDDDNNDDDDGDAGDDDGDDGDGGDDDGDDDGDYSDGDYGDDDGDDDGGDDYSHCNTVRTMLDQQPAFVDVWTCRQLIDEACSCYTLLLKGTARSVGSLCLSINEI